MDMLARYLSQNKQRVGKVLKTQGLIGVTPVLCCGKIRWNMTPPSCINHPRKKFASAIEAAQYYNELVTQHFGEYAITCDLYAAHQLDKKYAKLP
jgi:hypothetical protein